MRERAFNKRDDVEKLQGFLADMRQRVSQAAYFQFGDLLWRMSNPANHFNGQRDIRIWDTEDGRICGCIFYLSPNNPEFFMPPERYGSHLEDDMLMWALTTARERQVSSLETSCIDGDTPKAKFLARIGFHRVDDSMVFMERKLSEPFAICHLPEGYSMGAYPELPEMPTVTGGAVMTRAQYEMLRRTPGYRNDLDVKVWYQHQEVVSGCLCWYDDIDQCGEFEPVGTRKEHRRKGLAAAAMTRAMERLRHYGAHTAYVRTEKRNLPAIELYQKLGFRITHEDYGWERTV